MNDDGGRPLWVDGPARGAAADLAGPVVPRVTTRRNWVLPSLIVTSLAVHATIMLPSLLRRGDALPAQQQEIPIEIVQLPPKPAESPKPVERKAPEKKAEAKTEPPKRPPERTQPAPKPSNVADRLKDLLGPMPAVALPGLSADGTDAVSYSQLVLSKVAKAKKQGHYPGVPGAASVAFTVGDDGGLVTVAIVRPSGDKALDDEAIAMIRRGAPYPPPPPGGRRDFAITLRFEPLI